MSRCRRRGEHSPVGRRPPVRWKELLVRGPRAGDTGGGEPALVARLRDALDALVRPPLLVCPGACSTVPLGMPIAAAEAVTVDADALVVQLFQLEGASLVRLARLFVDDRNAAEDLVQEAFIRLAPRRPPDPGPVEGRRLPALDRVEPGP